MDCGARAEREWSEISNAPAPLTAQAINRQITGRLRIIENRESRLHVFKIRKKIHVMRLFSRLSHLLSGDLACRQYDSQ